MQSIDKLLDVAVGVARDGGASLCEARYVSTEQESLEVRNAEVRKNTSSVDRGIGMRVLVDGAWGYGATNELDEASIRAALGSAIELARANPMSRPAELASLEPQRGSYRTPCTRDPFDVPLSEKIELLRATTSAARVHEEVKIATASLMALRRHTRLKTDTGTDIDQEIILCGGGVTATAIGNDDVQMRSYPKADEGNVNAAGWEFVDSMDLVGHAPRMGEEARELLYAAPTPEGRRTLIVDGSQMSLQIHESCGHPVELDRALGEEISLAGASFLQPDRLGGFRYGSDIVNLYADSTAPGGPGTFAWDDEGVPAGRWDIVKGGRFVGYLGSRETAERVPGTVAGAMRSSRYAMLPIVRMVNVNLAPGTTPLEEMIAETEDGVYVAVNKSWSIDDFRLNFQFSCQLGWEIKNGEKTRMLKNPVYSGKTPEFWAGCDAIGDPSSWRMWGWMYCGKGDPVQLMHVGHGCGPARFQNVDIRST